MDAVLCKNLEELEARVDGILVESPASVSSLDLLVFQIRRRAEFIRTLLAAETAGMNSRHNLDQIAERLSVVETRFINWVASGGDTEFNRKQDKMAENQEEIAERLSFIESNFSYLNNNATMSTTESEEDGDDQEEGKEIVSGVILSEADIERITVEIFERVNKKRRDEWLKMIRAMGIVAALAAVTGFAISGFGSVEQSVYLVPT